MKKKPLIIGITGAFGSGKSTAADFFESRGFRRIALSSFLEEEAKRRGEKITRRVLQDIGNEWRTKYGASVLAKKALELLQRKNSGNYLIDGIRNVGEVDELRKYDRFVLIAMMANQKDRFERLKNLKRRESLTWEVFSRLDRRDLGFGQTRIGLQVALCQALADVFINNNGTLEELENRLEDFLRSHKL